MEDLYTIKETAVLAGVTPQAIYKRLYHKKSGGFIQEHLKEINGKKYLDKMAVDFILREKRITLKTDDPITNEINEILNKLNETNKKKVLKAAKAILEASKYE